MRYMYVCIGRGIEEGVQKTNVLELSDNSLININWFTPLDYRFVLHIQQTILTIITYKGLYNGTRFGRKFRDWQQRGLYTRVLILFFILIIHFYIRIHKLIMHKSTLIKQTLKIEEKKIKIKKQHTCFLNFDGIEIRRRWRHLWCHHPRTFGRWGIYLMLT